MNCFFVFLVPLFCGRTIPLKCHNRMPIPLSRYSTIVRAYRHSAMSTPDHKLSEHFQKTDLPFLHSISLPPPPLSHIHLDLMIEPSPLGYRVRSRCMPQSMSSGRYWWRWRRTAPPTCWTSGGPRSSGQRAATVIPLLTYSMTTCSSDLIFFQDECPVCLRVHCFNSLARRVLQDASSILMFRISFTPSTSLFLPLPSVSPITFLPAWTV